MNAIDAGHVFVEQRYPECIAAIVGGSVVRGDGTPTSDLDIVIVTDRQDAPYRESLRAFGWPIEVFVHSRTSYRRYFQSDSESRRPALALMCHEGIIVRDREGLARRIQDEAGALLERGPEPLTEEESDLWRYRITDLLDDFLGCDRLDEGMFIANDLAIGASDLILASHRQWIGRGKWVRRALQRFDPELAERLTQALQTYYRAEAKDDLIRFADDALAPVGGRLFEGYYSAGKRDETSP